MNGKKVEKNGKIWKQYKYDTYIKTNIRNK